MSTMPGKLRCAVPLLLLIAAPAAANTTRYTSDAAFNTADPNATNLDFNGFPEKFYGSPGLFTDQGVEIASNDNLFTRDEGFYGTGGFMSAQTQSPTIVSFTLPHPANFFGFDYYDSSSFTMSENGNVTPFGAVDTFPSLDFAGISDTTPFSKVTITVSGDGIDFDNLRFGSASSLPEPSTWLMMIMGFGSLGWSFRRRQGKVALASCRWS
jgi:hypothetical protein